MGACCGNRPSYQVTSTVKPENLRRRGSVSIVGDEEDASGKFEHLDVDILEMMQKTSPGQRRASLGSSTDQICASFESKTVVTKGDDVNLEQSGVGFACRKGLKPESPNQDSWSVLLAHDFSIYGVYDGHGKQGHDVSNFVKDTLPKLIINDPRFRGKPEHDTVESKHATNKSMLVDCFKEQQRFITAMNSQQKLSAKMSGTTATVVILDHAEHTLTISHVADSSAVLGKYTSSKKKKLLAKQLTRDHKPDLPDERARIECNGGRVVFDGYCNHRVYARGGRYPGLNMSRCLGDLLGHSDAGCSCEPEVLHEAISPLDHVLLLCSDGVWEFITPQEAVDVVAPMGPEMAMAAADKLAKLAWDRWIDEEGGSVVDDITAVVIYLQALTAAE